MMKRILTLISAIMIMMHAMAENKEFTVELSRHDNESQTLELPYGLLTMRLVSSNLSKRSYITVQFESLTVSQAILIFKHSENEKSLKANRPKITFVKTYPGAKNSRSVAGCEYVSGYFEAVVPAETVELFNVDVRSGTPLHLTLPFYLCKYNPKDLIKRGKHNVKYEILQEEFVNLDINVRTWTPEDPQYVRLKKQVVAFKDSLQKASICPNAKHVPSPDVQRRPYIERIAQLRRIASDVIQESDYMSESEGYKAYMEIIEELDGLNLSDYSHDCGKHKKRGGVRGGHSCSYCGLSAQDISHRLDDIYQLKRSGQISKQEAVRRARAYYNCYQANKKRDKTPLYTQKISNFYNSIQK